MQERLIIDVARVKPGGERIEGEVDAIDVAEEFVHPFGGIRYSLFVQVVGTELLVRGRAEQDFDLVCSRCGKDFDTTIKAEDIVTSIELGDELGDIDLTDEIREAVLLELPNYPVCDENCESAVPHGENPMSQNAGDGAGLGQIGAIFDGLKESALNLAIGIAAILPLS